jgi:hypothetical protein
MANPLPTQHHLAGWKSVKQAITTHSGLRIMEELRRLEKRSATLRNDMVFIKRCLHEGITSTGFGLKNRWSDVANAGQILRKAEEKLMKASLRQKYRELDYTNGKTIKTAEDLAAKVPGHVYAAIVRCIKEEATIHFHRTAQKQSDKFRHLVNKSSRYGPMNPTSQRPGPSEQQQPVTKTEYPIRSAVVNLSTHVLSQKEKEALECDPNFAIQQEDRDKDIIAVAVSVEQYLNQDEKMEEHQKDVARAGVSRILSRMSKVRPHRSQQEKELIGTLKQLKKDPSLVICRADKGNVTVVMDRIDYNTKIGNLLRDQDAYEPLAQDPTKETVLRLECSIKGLVGQKRISDKMGKFLRPTNPEAPTFFGMPKIHKEGVPLRPVVDYRKAPTYNLARFLKGVLQPVADKGPYTLKNSFDFVDKIRGVVVEEDEEMVSLDVVSLFTRVPVARTLSVINDRLIGDPDWRIGNHSLTRTDVMKLLTVCLSSTYFTWNGQSYKQKSGTPMGSPISTVVAELCMQDLERTCIPKIPCRLYHRFVDDSFAVVKKNHTDDILSELNSYDRSLEFTIEAERDGILNFLDVSLSRGPTDEIKCKVYRKPTHSGRYLHYRSFHHVSHKVSVVDSLAFRAFKICRGTDLEEELALIRSQLSRNGYPDGLITKRFHVMKSRVTLPVEKEEESRLILPFIGQKDSDQITRFIGSALGCKFGFHTGLKIRHLTFNHKEKGPPTEAQTVCYGIECKGCPKVSGKTKRHREYLGNTNAKKRRMKEHNLHNENPHNRDYSKESALFVHKRDNPGHHFDVAGARTIDVEQNPFARAFKESMFIHVAVHPINREEGIEVSPFWKTSLRKPFTNIFNRRIHSRVE